jgi:O-phosphoseryl-tRNA(Sec) kinase
MAKRVLICLVGLPAAGKSTLCSALLKHHTNFDIEHICYDNHIKAVNHEVDPSAWNKARQSLNYDIIKTVSGSADNYNRSKIYLLDDNFYYRSMRKEILHIAQKNSCVFGQIVFQVTLELSKSANLNRDDTIVTQETIQKMFDLMEYPSEAWERHVLHLRELTAFTESSLDDRVDQVLQFVDFLCKQQPEKDPSLDERKKEADRDKTLNDVVQQCDILLRKIISQRIKTDRLSGLNIPYNVYAETKSIFIKGIKGGTIQIEGKPTIEVVLSHYTILLDDTLSYHKE